MVDPLDERSSEPARPSQDGAASNPERKRQALGRQVVATLYMLVRNVRIHAPDNAIFLKPLDTLRDLINTVIALDQRMQLHGAGTDIVLNDVPLSFDFAAIESVAFLTKEFELRGIGGFAARRPVTSRELRDFIALFEGEPRDLASTEAPNSAAIQLARFAFAREVLDRICNAAIDPNQKIDRKKYLLTVYARGIFFMRRYVARIQREEPPPSLARAARIVQDLVDLSMEHRAHFLGVTTTRAENDYLPFHAVNCVLLALVFGAELGLDRRQLHDLGMAALFAPIGLAELPDAILLRQGGLSPKERALVDLLPLKSARRILECRGLDRQTVLRIVAAYESKVDYAIPRRASDGETELVAPKVNLGVYGRMIAIVETYDALTSRRPFREAYGPEIALALMSDQIKYRFDPLLLRVFMKVMAIQPIRVLHADAAKVEMA